MLVIKKIWLSLLDTLTDGKLKDVLSLKRFRRLDIMVLQDTRIAKSRTQVIMHAVREALLDAAVTNC